MEAGHSKTISIVIVNWKTPRLLAGCLDSILADPRHDHFEIWVVDNASADESVPMLAQRYPSVRVIANTANVGFPKACNQAIAAASGRHILLLNPDTLVVGDSVSVMADFLDEHPDCGAVGPQVLNTDGSLQLACRRSFPDPMAALFRVTNLSRLFPRHPLFAKYNLTYQDPSLLLEVDALSGSCMMVRREAINRVGMLDEDWFMYGEEIDWCWRIKQAGWKIFYNPEAVIYHYHGAASRLRPIKAIVDLHHGLALFYRKHIAPRYWQPLNLLVYGAIWLRAALLIAVSYASGIFKESDTLSRELTPEQELERIRLIILDRDSRCVDTAGSTRR